VPFVVICEVDPETLVYTLSDEGCALAREESPGIDNPAARLVEVVVDPRAWDGAALKV
jgi:hypothetical protein